MKYQVHKNYLLEPVANLVKLTSTQNQIKVYKYLQFNKVNDSTLLIAASNGNNTIKYYIDVLSIEGDSLMVNAKDFLMVINKLDGLIEFDNGKITCGKSVLNLPCIKENFIKDNDKEAEVEPIKFDYKEFKIAVQNRLFAVDTISNGVLSAISIVNNEVCSTNGNVLSLGKIAYNGEQILADNLFITNILNCMTANFNMYVNKNHIIAFNKNVTIISQLKEGKYPQYKGLLPNSFTSSFNIDKTKLLNTLDLLKTMSSNFKKVIVLEVEENSLKISLENENKHGVSVLDIDYKDEPIKIAFNIDLLYECVKNISDDTIIVNLNSSRSPAILTDENNNDYNLIMPIQLR